MAVLLQGNPAPLASRAEAAAAARTARCHSGFPTVTDKETIMTSTEVDIFRAVLDQWKSAVDAHDPKRVANDTSPTTRSSKAGTRSALARTV